MCISNTRICRLLEVDIYRNKLTFSIVVEMQPIEIPKFPRLSGEKAIKALHDFINELEEQRGKELTEKQTTAIIKFAKGLISSIEAEKRQAVNSNAHIKESFFVARVFTRPCYFR